MEYLDAIHHPGGDILDETAALFKKKYENIPLDAVLLTDDPAWNFLVERRDLLFPGVPLFFCALNNFHPERLEGMSAVTGVAENPDMRGTVELVRKLHPGIRKIPVVADRNPGSLLVLKNLERISRELHGEATFRALTDKNFPELLEELKRLPEGTPVLFHAFLRDASGTTFPSNLTVLKKLSETLSSPFYTFKRIDIGHGAVGGAVVSEELLGSLTARMLLDHLNGVPLEELPPIFDTPHAYIFDEAQLKRFGIDEQLLPQGSVVVNRHLSLIPDEAGALQRAFGSRCSGLSGKILERDRERASSDASYRPETVRKLLPCTYAASPAVHEKKVDADASVWNRTPFYDRLLEDRELARKVLADFLHDIPNQIRQLRTILRNGDSEGARRRAHAIKGAAASVDGESLRLAALDLERRALAGEQQELAVLADRLEASFEDLRAVMLKELRNGTKSHP